MAERAGLARARARVRSDLAEAGLVAGLLVRDLGTGREADVEADVLTPAASLAKLPLALAVLTRVDDGRLDGARPVEVPAGDPGEVTPGLGRFRHPAVVAVDDLVGLALTISDNAAADALLRLVPPDEVGADLERLGIGPMVLRHPFGDLSDTPLDRLPPHEAHLAHTLAIRGSTPAQGHPIRQLDVARTNVVTARSVADLLERVWTGRGLRPVVAARLREHLRGSVARHRLAPDLASDDARWASKTGTLLNLRHEAGVVEHADGARVVVVALSTSRVPATVQPAAEAALGAAARLLHDLVR
ncbi:serine hydrolase [Lapillicoccus jejuensis]|uniref:Beta-lactamase class A n=1 Tax=Lapillicoccus jejuensis TaxID=402171 RepID=A0A542DWD3_9MICO|nr:serine hydrolase [Lapillicoccus jejuensis]TQJ07398.1 beta-lactamase class A [Lapillicoccus jejuensis]